MIRRREFITLLGGAAAAWPATVGAQQTERMRRIGFLFGRPPSDRVLSHLNEFRRGMHDLGHIEGKDFVLEPRYADRQYGSSLTGLAEELVRLKVDIIVAAGSPAIRAAQQATTTIPIVIAATGDPVASGLVTSLAQPGGNTTGLSSLSPDLYTKHLQLMAMLLPKLARVAVLTNPDSSTHNAVLSAVENAGQAAGITIHPIDVGTPEEIIRGFSNLKQAQSDAVIVVPDSFLNGQTQQIAELSIKYRLPSTMEIREYVESGGLMSYGSNLADHFRRAATYVDKILKGAKPGEIPVEQPTKFELVINLKTAKALGLEIPDKLLALADEVFE
jgi:putative tryptophan/tyrosine transport system substrate-binding protein